MDRNLLMILGVGDDWNWIGKYDYLKNMGVSVVYFPYDKGVSSSSLKERIYSNYEKLKTKADNNFPQDVCRGIKNV